MALGNNTEGFRNTATGVSSLVANRTGNDNTATGNGALADNFTGSKNTATGAEALFANAADNNTATGYSALTHNTTGTQNTANGVDALLSNTIGDSNTAAGFQALSKNVAGADNTAAGVDALLSNITGNSNTATGSNALQLNTAGSNNTATGLSALFSNGTGNNNTACGVSALASNTSGHDNLAAGPFALFQNKMGSFNIALGSNAGVNLTGSNNIDIGATGMAAESNTIRIGKSGTQKKTFIAGIRGVTVASGVGVIVGSSGQLGTVVSSARFKEAIKPMDKASAAILNLKPVTFRYKKEVDPDKIPQFGLVAEEVEKVDPDLVIRDEEGKVSTVRYEAVNAMLLNEFLKEHKKVQELEKQIAALTAVVQKVSDQLETNRSASKIFAND